MDGIIIAYFVGFGIIVVASFIAMLSWLGEYKGSVEIINAMKVNKYRGRLSRDSVERARVKEIRYLKRSLYALFLSPIWPLLIPSVIIGWLVKQIYSAIRVVFQA